MTALCRRTLLKSAAATCGAGLLAACGRQDTASTPAAPPAPTAASSGAVPSGPSLGAVAAIPVGGAVEVTAPDGTKVLLTQAEQGQVRAFSAVCPHEGCTVAPDGAQLSCPCHGSAFALDGSLERGPADRGLTPYAVQVVDGQVLPA